MKQNRILRRGRRADNSLLPALAVITFASCTATPPESRTVEIDPSAITVFEEGEALWGVRDIIPVRRGNLGPHGSGTLPSGL